MEYSELGCLKALKKEKIDLILRYWNMPEMDGLEFLEKIKEHAEGENIPIIMCSSLANIESVRKVVKAGCKHYVIKPFKREYLVAKV